MVEMELLQPTVTAWVPVPTAAPCNQVSGSALLLLRLLWLIIPEIQVLIHDVDETLTVKITQVFEGKRIHPIGHQ